MHGVLLYAADRLSGIEACTEQRHAESRWLALDPNSAVAALTHDPRLDHMALLEALKSPAFYVGALGLEASNARRRERLLRYFDLSPAEVDPLHGPFGPPIGSRTPPEIAVSIVAGVTAAKNSIRLAPMPEPAASEPHHSTGSQAAASILRTDLSAA